MDTITAQRPSPSWPGSARWQVAGILGACVFLTLLNAGNDGLWFQGDAPRHAITGFFWWDLISSLPRDPVAYAVRYYARYPAIAPLAYPPLFHVVEGVAFAVFGPSPYVAKTLVMAFAALAACYTTAWSRRWMGREAGWAGVFLLLLPGVALYAQGVMLNIPTTALSTGGLYHFRRWLETRTKTQLVLAASLVLMAILTYYLAVVAIVVCAGWFVLGARRDAARRRRMLWAGAIAAGILLPLAFALRGIPFLVSRNAPQLRMLPFLWTYYLPQMVTMFGPTWSLLGLAGLVAGLSARESRANTVYLVAWIGAILLVLAFMSGRSPRYMLPFAPAGAMAGVTAVSVLASRWRGGRAVAYPVGLVLLGVASVTAAALTVVPRHDGYREVATYLRQAGADAIFYDGYHDGLFIFYVRAGDPAFSQRVVLGSKLLYFYGPTTQWDWSVRTNLTSAADVVTALRERGGCRWLAIEYGPNSEQTEPQKYIRDAVRGPEFELVRSFPVRGAETRVDVYRFLPALEPSPVVDVAFPSFGNRVYRNVEPITR